MHPSPKSENHLPVLQCAPLTLALLPEVLDLDRLCLGGLWSEAGYRREIESPNSDLLVVQLQRPAAAPVLALGCLWSILDEAHITTLAVHPDYHRLKIGQWLLVQLLRSALARQLTHATLEVRASNQAALGLYQKFDFQTAGRRRRYYANGEDALILWRSSLQTASCTQTLQNLCLDAEQVFRRLGWRVGTPFPIFP